jgi:hypothetical protein
VSSLGSSELDGKMAQATNAHNTDSILGAETVLGQDCVDSGSRAEERGRISRVVSIRNGCNSLRVPDSTVGERTVVGIRETINLTLTAVLVEVYCRVSTMGNSKYIGSLPVQQLSQEPQI